VLGNSAMVVLVPILERIVGWQRPQIRRFLESYGFITTEWDTARTDWLTLRPALAEPSSTRVA